MKICKLLVLAFALEVLAIRWPWEDDPTSTSTSIQSATSSASSTARNEVKQDNPYVPNATDCPDGDIVREAIDIHDKEKEYIQKRQEITNDNLASFLLDVAQLSNFNALSFIDDNKNKHNITIGLAFSGGGYRAMLSGAGELLALDNRYGDLSLKGLGGLLQSSSYISGLSGGSWLVGSLALNDWLTVAEAALEDSGIWELDDLIFNPSGINVVKTVQYYYALYQAVNAKGNAGFETSITDVWGRALSYQFFNEDTSDYGGENVTWSSIQKSDSFANHSMPFPLLIANGRTPGTLIINENSTVFEITPYELGSWDPSLNSFVDLNYMGTTLDAGRPNSSQCVTNFDNAGFILGTLSSLFNQALVRVQSDSDLNFAVQKVLEMSLQPFSENNVDIATYKPNPFYNIENGNLKSIVSDPVLHLADGGEDSQNVPLYPLIQSQRGVDIIFAYDNSADTESKWPNGTSLVHTFQRQFADQGLGTPFPYVPPVSEFVSKRFNERPVFFGCDAANLTDLVEYHDSGVNETDIPLVVYMPHLHHLFESNKSTYKMSYDKEEIAGMIQNGFEVSSRGNYSDDRAWPTCVGCAIIRRQQERLGQEQSDECKKCFQSYCWVGKIEDTPQQSIGSFNTVGLTALLFSRSLTSNESGSSQSSTSSGQSQSQSSLSQTSQISVAPGSTFQTSTIRAGSSLQSATSSTSSQGIGSKSTWNGLLMVLSVFSLF